MPERYHFNSQNHESTQPRLEVEMPPADFSETIRPAIEATRQAAAERAREQVKARQPDVERARAEVRAAFRAALAETNPGYMQQPPRIARLQPEQPPQIAEIDYVEHAVAEEAITEPITVQAEALPDAEVDVVNDEPHPAPVDEALEAARVHLQEVQDAKQQASPQENVAEEAPEAPQVESYEEQPADSEELQTETVQKEETEDSPEVSLEKAKTAVERSLGTAVEVVSHMDRQQDARYGHVRSQIDRLRGQLNRRMGGVVQQQEVRQLGEAISVIEMQLRLAHKEEQDKKTHLARPIQHMATAAKEEAIPEGKRQVFGDNFKKLYEAAKRYDSENQLGSCVQGVRSLLSGQLKGAEYGYIVRKLSQVENELKAMTVSKQQQKERNPQQFQQFLRDMQTVFAEL